MRKYSKLLLLVFLTCIFLLIIQPVVETSDIDPYLYEIDREFARYSETKNEDIIRRILEQLHRLEENNSNNNIEVLWRLGKAYHYLGIHQGNDIATWARGKSYLEQAVQSQPKVADVYFWLAALTGQIGQEEGVLNSLFMLRPMREWLEKAIEIDSNYADAYYGLGRLYFQAPGWPLSFGDDNKALYFMKEAVRINPENLEFQTGLFKVLDKLGRKEEASEVLNTIKKLEDR